MLPFVRLPLVGSALSTYAIIRTAYIFLALWLTVRLSERQGIRASTMLGASKMTARKRIQRAGLKTYRDPRDPLDHRGEPPYVSSPALVVKLVDTLS